MQNYVRWLASWRVKMKYRSDILQTIHENATANYEIGAISKAKMQEYDAMCLVSEPDAFAEYKITDTAETVSAFAC